jgi:hypothetical protein
VTTLIENGPEPSAQADEILIPLDLESVFGWFTWLLLGLLFLLPGVPLLVAGALRADLAVAATGAVATAPGLLAIRKLLRVLIRQLTISAEGISLRRGLARKEIPWKDVQFYRFQLRNLDRPFYASFHIRSQATVISFAVRPEWFWTVHDRIKRACPQAFSLDCTTGQIFPPREDNLANFLNAEFGRVARRESARFRWLAMAQVLGLPVFAILLVAVLMGPIWVIGWKMFPYGIADIAANFRRATAAWQSYAQHASE